MTATAGESEAELSKSPFLEKLVAKGYEVILFTDPVDEYVAQHLSEYDDKKLQNASKENLKLGGKDDKEKKSDKKLKASLGHHHDRVCPCAMQCVCVCVSVGRQGVQHAPVSVDSRACLHGHASACACSCFRVLVPFLRMRLFVSVSISCMHKYLAQPVRTAVVQSLLHCCTLSVHEQCQP